MTSSRNRLLLMLAIGLAGIKFLVLPWIEQQAAAAERLAVLTQRLDRSTGVVQNRESIRKAVDEVEKSTITARTRFPDEPDVEGYRLGVQQNIGSAGTTAGVTLKAFEWIVDGEVKPARLVYSRARVQFEGGFRNLVTLQANLESRYPNMVIRELNLSSSAMIGAPDESLASLTLVADFYFRPSAAGGVQ